MAAVASLIVPNTCQNAASRTHSPPVVGSSPTRPTDLAIVRTAVPFAVAGLPTRQESSHDPRCPVHHRLRRTTRRWPCQSVNVMFEH